MALIKHWTRGIYQIILKKRYFRQESLTVEFRPIISKARNMLRKITCWLYDIFESNRFWHSMCNLIPVVYFSLTQMHYSDQVRFLMYYRHILNLVWYVNVVSTYFTLTESLLCNTNFIHKTKTKERVSFASQWMKVMPSEKKIVSTGAPVIWGLIYANNMLQTGKVSMLTELIKMS